MFATGLLNNILVFNASCVTWTTLFPTGVLPSPRASMGFTATADKKFYLFGGKTSLENTVTGCSTSSSFTRFYGVYLSKKFFIKYISWYAEKSWSKELFCFQQATLSWTFLNISNGPSARYEMGFTSTSNGNLYLFGGFGYSDVNGGDQYLFLPLPNTLWVIQ